METKKSKSGYFDAQSFVLRLPRRLAVHVRQLIAKGADSDINVEFIDGRNGIYHVGKERYHFIVFNFPTFIESYKTIDTRNYFKCGNIVQMIKVYDHPPVTSEEKLKKLRSFASDQEKRAYYTLADGITPPTKNIKYKFDKDAKKKDMKEIIKMYELYMNMSLEDEMKPTIKPVSVNENKPDFRKAVESFDDGSKQQETKIQKQPQVDDWETSQQMFTARSPSSRGSSGGGFTPRFGFARGVFSSGSSTGGSGSGYGTPNSAGSITPQGLQGPGSEIRPRTESSEKKLPPLNVLLNRRKEFDTQLSFTQQQIQSKKREIADNPNMDKKRLAKRQKYIEKWTNYYEQLTKNIKVIDSMIEKKREQAMQQ